MKKAEKRKFSKILPNNQVITACRIELQVQKMTMKKKLTMIGLTKNSVVKIQNLTMNHESSPVKSNSA